MKTRVGLCHEPRRKLPWRVYWHGDPDPETGRQRKYVKSFRHSREAKAFQAEKQAALNQGERRGRPEVIQLGRLLDEFTESRLSGLSHSSQVSYGNTVQQLRDHFGDGRLIRSIEQRHAEMFIASRRRLDGRAGELSSWSKSHHVKHCRAIFHAAADWGYIDRNPFVPPARAGGNSPLTVKGRSGPWHHLVPAEFDKLLAVVPITRIHIRAVYWLMYGCGLRPGEAVNTTIDGIDLDSRVVHVRNRQGTADVPPFTIKGEDRASESKERCLTIPTAAIQDLAEAVKAAFRSGGFVALTARRFATIQEQWRLCRDHEPWGGHVWRPWQNRDMVNNLLRDTRSYFRKAKSKLTAPFCLHTFRKSFAQNHADAGTQPRTLADLLGHADVRLTMSYYNRVTDANRVAAAETMDRLLSSQDRDTFKVRGAV